MSVSCSKKADATGAETEIDNILFHLLYDEACYYLTVEVSLLVNCCSSTNRHCVEVCALVAHLDILKHGDESEIEERGVRLAQWIMWFANDKTVTGQSLGWKKATGYVLLIVCFLNSNRNQSHSLGRFVSCIFTNWVR